MINRAPRTRTISVGDLRDLVESLLRSAGCPPDTAQATAEAFVEAELRGKGLQGLDHLSGLLEALASGALDAAAQPAIARDGPAFALIDGGGGPGPPALSFAAGVAVEKARAAGAAAVGVRHAGDVFMLGLYAEAVARAGLVGLAWTGSHPLVHPHGGSERALGTNPLAIAVPAGPGDDPVLLDMATSALAAGRVRQASYHGASVPPGTGLDERGEPTIDAAAVRRGAIAPLGGAKGSGLGLCVALLAGPLVGAAAGRALGDLPAGHGHLLVAIDPAAFGDADAFGAAVAAYVREVKGTRREEGVEEILVPGEGGLRRRRAALAAGRVEVLETVWEQVAGIAGRLGVAMP